MAWTYYEDSQTISNTEYSLTASSTSLTAKTDEGALQVFIDVSNVAAGDQYFVRFYEKARSAGTQRLVKEWIIDGVQADPQWVSPSFLVSRGWEWTMKRLAGSDRNFQWSIRVAA